mmetsp:Transcript_19619/g.46053  ORF Transcript_19619/g.46053 Transcript_19619/m.46053 type:complete len:126 (+) Transcript_19619:545-922(+)
MVYFIGLPSSSATAKTGHSSSSLLIDCQPSASNRSFGDDRKPAGCLAACREASRLSASSDGSDGANEWFNRTVAAKRMASVADALMFAETKPASECYCQLLSTVCVILVVGDYKSVLVNCCPLSV